MVRPREVRTARGPGVPSFRVMPVVVTAGTTWLPFLPGVTWRSGFRARQVPSRQARTGSRVWVRVRVPLGLAVVWAVGVVRAAAMTGLPVACARATAWAAESGAGRDGVVAAGRGALGADGVAWADGAAWAAWAAGVSARMLPASIGSARMVISLRACRTRPGLRVMNWPLGKCGQLRKDLVNDLYGHIAQAWWHDDLRGRKAVLRQLRCRFEGCCGRLERLSTSHNRQVTSGYA